MNFVSTTSKDHILSLKFWVFSSFWCFLGSSKNDSAAHLLSGVAVNIHVLCILTLCEISGHVHFKIMIVA